MMTPRERYQNDVKFHTLVDLMVHEIAECQYTPTEMREAAILASIIYDEHRLDRNATLLNVELEKSLRIVEKFLDNPGE